MLGGGGPGGVRRAAVGNSTPGPPWTPPTPSSRAGCAELYFLRYGHTDRWAHPDGQTTDKCNGHAHASSRTPHPSPASTAPREPPLPPPEPLAPPAWGEGWALPRDAGRRDWGGGQLSQPHSSGQRWDPAPHCPMGNGLTKGGTQRPTVPAAPSPGDAGWAGSKAELCQHLCPGTRQCQSTPRCRASPPEHEGLRAACCAPPLQCHTAQHHHTCPEGATRELPWDQAPPAHSAVGRRDPTLTGGWGTHAGHSTARRIRPRQPAPAGGVPCTPG